ncbi:MAG: gamma-glutamyl-gamma-aminobutyrate hydrolase family protein [Solirubrobacterales bacterium]
MRSRSRRDAGGLSFLLPFPAHEREDVVDRLDGLLLSGGEDLEPALSGAPGARMASPDGTLVDGLVAVAHAPDELVEAGRGAARGE